MKPHTLELSFLPKDLELRISLEKLGKEQQNKPKVTHTKEIIRKGSSEIENKISKANF